MLNCLSQHQLLLLLVACFVTATYALVLSCSLLCLSITSNIRYCSLMCLALFQHHAALALSCALLCLSITLLLLSHVPCFVSASRYSCSLMCLALSQHHTAHVPFLVSTCHTALFSALPCPGIYGPGYSIMSIAQHVKQSCNVNGCEILDCPMN